LERSRCAYAPNPASGNGQRDAACCGSPAIAAASGIGSGFAAVATRFAFDRSFCPHQERPGSRVCGGCSGRPGMVDPPAPAFGMISTAAHCA
jgi:hypothetical protein